MCDMLPADMRLREHVLSMIKTTYATYGFMQIETPVMEHIENLTSKQGGDNEKLIFKVMKRGAELQRAIEKGDGESFMKYIKRIAKNGIDKSSLVGANECPVFEKYDDRIPSELLRKAYVADRLRTDEIMEMFEE